MRNATPAFMRALADDRRDYQNRAVITLADDTVLQINNSDGYVLEVQGVELENPTELTGSGIWEDGLKIEDAVSADGVFQIGGAIINQATLVINNIYDAYSEYDFTGAHVVLYTGLNDLDNGTDEEIRLGTFTVDEAEYNGSIITLKCLDDMYRFDRPYTFDAPTDDEIIYPASLYTIVSNACHNCGVTLATNSLNFPHNDYVVTNMPSGESTTYRQVISWAAQIACCFARCNANGQLEIRFYDTTALDGVESGLDGGSFDDSTPYSTGDTADGGSFYPWNTGIEYDGGTFLSYPNVDLISSSYQSKLSTDDVVITGVKVVKKVESENSQDAYEEYTSGTSGYVISVENNDFIDGTHGQDVANWMGTALIGLRFRQAEITHPSDPTIEAGDVALFWDLKGNRYTIVVSSTSFACGNSQRTTSSAATPAKNSQQRYSESTRNYVELRRQQVRDFNSLAQLIAESGGLYETDVTVSGATQRWYHDKPDLADSEIVMVFTTAGFTLCDDYHTKTSMVPPQDPTWYGMTVDGQMIASILTASGVNADWINTGAFTVRDANGNITFQADADTGSVTIKATDVPRQYFGNGAPTSSTYPEIQWTTADLKAYHVGDLYTDVVSKKVYKYVYGYSGSTIKFSSNCITESISYDYLIIYFEYDGQYYAYPKIGGGRGSTENTIANAEFFIPSTEYYMRWRTDSSVTEYGWKIDSCYHEYVADFPSTATAVSDLPTGLTPVTATTATPETSHPYTSNVDELWTVQTGHAGGTFGYSWEEVVGAEIDPQEVIDELTQQEIFDILTNNGTAQGIYLQNGQLYILFTYAKGGTLTLGGASNANGVLVLKNSSDSEIGRWDNTGFYYGTPGSSGSFIIYPNGATVSSIAGINIQAGTKLLISNSGTIYADTIVLSQNPASTSMNHVAIGSPSGQAPYVRLRNGSQTGGSATIYCKTGMSDSIAYGSGFEIYGYNIVRLSTNDTEYLDVTDSGTLVNGYIRIQGNCKITGNLDVDGTDKFRVINTKNDGEVSMAAYETATPYFGDMGTGQIGEDGTAIIGIDHVFSETINLDIEYLVFLQKEGPGDIWVSEKDPSFFAVSGTPGLRFAWEMKAVQTGHVDTRPEDYFARRSSEVVDENVGLSMDDDLDALDAEELFDEIVDEDLFDEVA